MHLHPIRASWYSRVLTATQKNNASRHAVSEPSTHTHTRVWIYIYIHTNTHQFIDPFTSQAGKPRTRSLPCQTATPLGFPRRRSSLGHLRSSPCNQILPLEGTRSTQGRSAWRGTRKPFRCVLAGFRPLKGCWRQSLPGAALEHHDAACVVNVLVCQDYSDLFFSILFSFCSILFYSIRCYSVLFCSILFWSVLIFLSILFISMSISFYFHYSTLLYSTLI